MKNHDYKELKAELKKDPAIVITTHRGPDGDAMGSSLALYQVLKAQGHRVSVVVPNSYAKFLHWLPYNKDVIEFEGNEEKSQVLIDAADLIFCLDFNDLRRTDMMCTALEGTTAKYIMIDHHQEPSDFAHFTYSVPTVCSTAQLIYEFFEQMGWKDFLTVDIA